MAIEREFDVIVECDAGGYYVASVPALRGCQTLAVQLNRGVRWLLTSKRLDARMSI
jgi:hypothetical protein